MNWREQVGKLVTQDGREAWRVIGYCDEPTVVIENCETKERISTGISGLLARDWMPLVPLNKSMDMSDPARFRVGDRVQVFNRYLFAVPVLATVAAISSHDQALQLIFDEGQHGLQNVTKHNQGYFFQEECRGIEP